MGFVVFVLIVVLLSVVVPAVWPVLPVGPVPVAVRLLAVELLPVVGPVLAAGPVPAVVPVLAAEPLVLAEPEPAALAEALPVLDPAADKLEPVAEQVLAVQAAVDIPALEPVPVDMVHIPEAEQAVPGMAHTPEVALAVPVDIIVVLILLSLMQISSCINSVEITCTIIRIFTHNR